MAGSDNKDGTYSMAFTALLAPDCRLDIGVGKHRRSLARFPSKNRTRGKSAPSWVVPATGLFADIRAIAETDLRVKQSPNNLSSCEKTSYWFAVLGRDNTGAAWIDL